MSQGKSINDKTVALTNNIYMNSTTKFIRTGSISPPTNQP
jgi:hypothetical protein